MVQCKGSLSDKVALITGGGTGICAGVALGLVMHYYPTRVTGVSNKDAMLLHEQRFEIWKELTLQLNWDMALPRGETSFR